MIKVLFVDDEPRVLRGLQRMLSNHDCEWETAFVESGQAALDLMVKQPFDVVVSDMRMPEMDGAALLSEVLRRHPHVVRIVLSGHSDRELVYRSVGVAHQYLAKPCDPDQLQSVVMRACHLRELLRDTSLRSLASQLTRIPSPPDLYHQVMLHVEGSDKSIKELGNLISRDIGMTAKILQIVNSAFFGLPQHVSDPLHAVRLLGIEVIKGLILSAHIFSELRISGIDDLGLSRLWTHSAGTGAIARSIATTEGCSQEVRDHALLAGLLHDTGRLILAVNMPERCREAIGLIAGGAMTLVEAEQKVFGTSHAEVGAYLLGLWGLPDSTIEAVALHHRPSECMATAFTALTAVHAADAIEHTQREGPDAPGGTRLDIPYLERLGLAQRVADWEGEVLAEANQ